MKIVCLNGGLGNQLFQVCFAAYLRQRGSEVTWVDRSHLISLTRRTLKRQIELDPQYFDFKSTVAGKFVWRAPRLVRDRVVHTFKEPADWGIESIHPKSLFVMGYFQDRELVDQVSDLIVPRLGKLVVQRAFGRPYVAVHLRLGDYLSPGVRARHGVTDPVWSLERALELAESLGVERRVICTDSPGIVSEMVHGGLLDHFEIDSSRSPWEVLGTLSQAEGLVMANSSLSWWAARLLMAKSDEAVPVVHPLPWMAEPSKLDSSLLEIRATPTQRRILF